MNLNQLINMVTNQVLRRVVNIVVDRGFKLVARKPTPPAVDPKPTSAKHITTPAELANDAKSQTVADQAAKMGQIDRRAGR